jgi:hypothetical protein
VTSLPILIIGAPALLAVIAFKKAQKQGDKTGGHRPEESSDWAWPRYRACRRSETSR